MSHAQSEEPTTRPVALPRFTETGVVVALTQVLVPFMVLAVWAALQKLDPQVENAAMSLGASRPAVWRRATTQVGRRSVSSSTIFSTRARATSFVDETSSRRITFAIRP